MHIRLRPGLVAFLLAVWAGGDALAQKKGEPAKPAAESSTALEVKGKGAKTFYADSRAGNNQVTVLSESTLEDFTSVCNKVAGHCQFDPQRVESLSGEFSINVADIRTGIELRDEHLRGPDWFDAARHPKVVIAIEKVEDVRKTAGNAATLVLVGKCTMHGQTRDVRIPATLAYLDETPETMRRVKGDLIRIRASFDVTLADYGITGPPESGTIGLKVGETVAVKVTLFCSTERPPEDLRPDKPDKPGDQAPPAPKPPEPKPRK